MTKIFTPFCRSRRADSKYIYFVGSHKVFFYYNYVIGGKNSKIVQIPRLSGTYIYLESANIHFMRDFRVRSDSTLRFDLLYGSIVPSRLTFFSRKVSLDGTIEPYKRSNRKVQSNL